MPYRRHALGLFVLASCLLSTIALGQTAPPDTNDIRARIAAAGDAEKHDADAVVVLDETTVRVRPSGIGTARRHNVTKILREAGLKSQAVQVFGFDPATNRLDLRSVRVYRAGGEIDEISLDTKVLQPQPASGVFWGTQQYLVSVPRLEVGDAVETITEMTGFNVAYLADRESPAGGQAAVAGNAAAELNALGQPLDPPVAGHWHDEAPFWTTTYPVLEKRYTVRVPKDKPLQYGVYNGELRTVVTTDGDDIVYTFEKKDLRPLKSEQNMEPWPNVAPKLLLATLPSWEEKSRWLHAVSEPMLEPDDAIRAKVAELIKGCKTDEEKYTALNHWVAENIRYAGTSRGMCEGYTIHDIKETFHDRAGVCKDKAGMLCGMLRVAGFDSFIVMTMARQRVDAIPADQFNHAVTCIRGKDGKLTLLDPTWMPKSRDNWSTLEPLQHVVYGVPEGLGLAQSPYFPPETSQVEWKAQTTIAPDGALSGELHWTACGTPETRVRRALANLTPDERPNYFTEAFQALSPNVRIEKLECGEPDDFKGPLTLRSSFESAGFALTGVGKAYLALPMMQTPLGATALKDLFGNCDPKERKFGLKLWATRLAKIDETITLPDGWAVADAPKPVAIDGPVAGLKFKLDHDKQRLHYSCELTIKKWIVAPEEYANFKEVMQKFEELTGRVVACTTTGSAAGTSTKQPARGASPEAQAARFDEGQAWRAAQRDPDALIELWEQHWTVQPSGELVYREKQHVRINNDRAHHDFADPRITYNADSDKLEILTARVKRADGSYRELPDYSHVIVAPDATAGWPAFASLRQHLLVMSGIEPGCIIELEYRITSAPGTKPHGADVQLDSRYPVVQRVIRIDGPTDVAVQCELANVPEGTKKSPLVNKLLTTEGEPLKAPVELTLENLPANPDEAQTAPWQVRCAMLAFSVGFDGADLEHELLERVAAAADGSEYVRELAAKWTEGWTAPDDKLRAIQEHLAKRFNFVDFASEWQPAGLRPASEVLASGYGLPAEAAAAFLSLAKAAELEVRPVALAQGRVRDESVARRSYLSSYGVALVQPEDVDVCGRFTTTEVWEPRRGRIDWEGPWAEYRLVVPRDTSEGIDLDAWCDPAYSQLAVRGTLKLTSEGTYSGTLCIQTSGVFVHSETLRTAEAQKARVAALVQRIAPEAEIESFTTRMLASGRFDFEARVRSGKPLSKVDGGWVFTLAQNGPALLDVPLPLSRSAYAAPVLLSAAFEERLNLVLELPHTDGLLVSPHAFSVDSEWGGVDLHAELAESKLRLDRRVCVSTNELAPAMMLGVRTAMNQLRAAAARAVIYAP